jgi:FkbM family methyltransferase
MVEENAPQSFGLAHVIDRLNALERREISRPYYFMGGNWALTKLSNGAPFFINTNDKSICTWIAMAGVWETRTDDVLCNFTKPGMIVLDIGSNVGYYSVKLGAIVGPTGRLYSFEPNPELYPFTRENLTINGLLGHCTPHDFGLGAESGSATLNFGHSNMGGGSLVKEPSEQFNNSVQVQVRRLDDVLHTVSGVDLMKIDVEGFEPQVIKGSAAILSRSPRCAMLIEIYRRDWLKHGSLESQLSVLSRDKRLMVILEDGKLHPIEPASVDDFLFARAGEIADFFICPPDRLENVAQYLA